jgi:hypothetical protein
MSMIVIIPIRCKVPLRCLNKTTMEHRIRKVCVTTFDDKKETNNFEKPNQKLPRSFNRLCKYLPLFRLFGGESFRAFISQMKPTSQNNLMLC